MHLRGLNGPLIGVVISIKTVMMKDVRFRQLAIRNNIQFQQAGCFSLYALLVVVEETCVSGHLRLCVPMTNRRFAAAAGRPGSRQKALPASSSLGCL